MAIINRLTEINISNLNSSTLGDNIKVVDSNSLIYPIITKIGSVPDTITNCKYLGCKYSKESDTEYKILLGSYIIKQDHTSSIITSVSKSVFMEYSDYCTKNNEDFNVSGDTITPYLLLGINNFGTISTEKLSCGTPTITALEEKELLVIYIHII
jgi:hypothetical protein